LRRSVRLGHSRLCAHLPPRDSVAFDKGNGRLVPQISRKKRPMIGQRADRHSWKRHSQSFTANALSRTKLFFVRYTLADSAEHRPRRVWSGSKKVDKAMKLRWPTSIRWPAADIVRGFHPVLGNSAEFFNPPRRRRAVGERAHGHLGAAGGGADSGPFRQGRGPAVGARSP